ncbi:protein kinase [Histoplasma capsulatum G186AR]|uniref:Protein kinase n=1 Tax=Ajellomyces capsulatus (strain G186AR / H82 / ATCC MYA-2454 / RMSCC 2432) TaxID=447093 RepID=C0NZ84_AJECG|nr:protein kinase [Histoplasma capsulatum G186AR]EEH03132.1 protein kinase [Histoplasma capsulatum G186AR]
MRGGSFRLPASIITSPLLAFPNTRPVSLPISLLHFWPAAVRTMASTSHSPPRRFPSSGFVVLDPKLKVEEEELPSYVPGDFYPVTIGEVFVERYQVVAKLGFVCTSHKQQNNEITICNHLKASNIEHPGTPFVRMILDSFNIMGPTGNQHQCLLYQPLGMSYTEFLDLFPNKQMPETLLQRSMQLILLGLDYLHKAKVVHTDISANNILQGITNLTALSEIEEGEASQPIARKVLDDRTIYISRPMPINTGLPVLCDFGEAHIGDKHNGDVMPGIYRAPEVILGMEWDCKVDIWAVGLTTWDLLETGNLFFARKDGLLNDEQHLAEMVSLLGPPPREFIRRSNKCLQYWDENANWKGSIPIPEQSFEIRERSLERDARTMFLHFLRSALAWLPEERLPAEDLARHAFLMQPLLAAGGPKHHP